jgi:hypothetical protein
VLISVNQWFIFLFRFTEDNEGLEQPILYLRPSASICGSIF